MIRVERPVDEPENFNVECRERGRAWIAAHPNPKGRPLDYWSPFRDELRELFRRRCGYFAMYIHDGTIDHYISWDNCKADRPELAYEWNNFRFVAPTLNSKKRTKDALLLDPYDVQDDWFEVEIPSLVLRMTNRIPDAFRDRARFTVSSEGLDLEQGRKAISNRWEWYDLHRTDDLTLDGLTRVAPLVASAVRAWRDAGRGPLPEIPRPVP